jgi:hypothetical protein
MLKQNGEIDTGLPVIKQPIICIVRQQFYFPAKRGELVWKANAMSDRWCVRVSDFARRTA